MEKVNIMIKRMIEINDWIENSDDLSAKIIKWTAEILFVITMFAAMLFVLIIS